MKSKKKWANGAPVHIYIKGVAGQVIFFETEDFIFFVTLLCVTAAKMNVEIISISLMINHIHLLVKVRDEKTLTKFIMILNSKFVTQYNRAWNRQGRLLEHAGWAQKKVMKDVRACCVYIARNPVEGHLSKSALDYRWNLLAYLQSRFPYSEHVNRAQAGIKLRRAMDEVRARHLAKRPMGYVQMRRLFSSLDKKETAQLEDYILSLYNPLSLSAFNDLFDGFDKAIEAFALSPGKEFDLPDDWSDYSLYREALSVKRRILGGRKIHVSNLGSVDLRKIRRGLLHRMPESMICKFLHLKLALVA